MPNLWNSAKMKGCLKALSNARETCLRRLEFHHHMALPAHSGPQIHRSLRALLWYVLSTSIILYRSTVWQDVRLSPRCQLSPRRCHNQSKTMRVSHGLSLTRLPDWHLDVDSTYSGAVAQAKHQEYVPAHDPLPIHTVESRPFG